ncbi:MAG: phosphatase PAP2 family protein [Actinobacteria bacterium]|nr:phosphatase PAP2 family protein [Actinomycetota bacterium]MCL5447197.1 phosphatase PAP2 family protein [Actinomycetota bacterium]
MGTQSSPVGMGRSTGSIATGIYRFDYTIDSALQYVRGIHALDASSALLTKLADYGLVWALIGAVRALSRPQARRNTVHAILFTSMTAPSLNWSLKYIVRRPRPYEADPCGKLEPGESSPPKSSSAGSGPSRRSGSGNISGLQQRREHTSSAPTPVVTGRFASRNAHPTTATPAPLGESYGVRTPGSPSFPSGHTLTAWCAATVLAAGDPLGPVYYLLASAVSYSRLHLGHHYATDVIGGMVMGIGLGYIGRRILK